MQGRILIVEDTPALMQSLMDILEMEGYNVTGANDGQMALDIMLRMNFDLVISDIRMPKMDGIELIRAIRADSRWEKLPILVFSARLDEASKQLALKTGANDFLPKPSSSDLILRSIQILLR